MYAIAPALLCLAFLLDPKPSPSNEAAAAALVATTAAVWVTEIFINCTRKR